MKSGGKNSISTTYSSAQIWMGRTNPEDAESGRWCKLPGGIDKWTLEYTTSGQEQVMAPDGRTFNMEAGTALLFRPGAFRNHGQAPGCAEWARYFCSFRPRPHWESELLEWPELYPGAMALAVPATVRDRIEPIFPQAIEVFRSACTLRGEMVMNFIEQVLLWIHTVNPRNRQARLDPGIQNAMHYASMHFTRPLRMTDLAAQAGMSRAHFTRRFHEQTGITPRRFLETVRIEEARHLLSNKSLSVAGVAYACGFDDAAHFNRVFKTRTGKTPGAFRQSGE